MLFGIQINDYFRGWIIIQIIDNLRDQRAGHSGWRNRPSGACSRKVDFDKRCIRRLPDSEEALLPNVAVLVVA